MFWNACGGGGVAINYEADDRSWEVEEADVGKMFTVAYEGF